MNERATGRSAEVALPAKATSPARARQFVTRTLGAWGTGDADDATLVVSELVTNALLHARTAMTVRLTECGDGTVRLSVRDGSAHALQQRNFSVESGTGRGLRLLDSLAVEWGVDDDGEGDGKTVWCVLGAGPSAAFADFDADAVEAL